MGGKLWARGVHLYMKGGGGGRKVFSNLNREVLLQCCEENMRSFTGGSVELVKMVRLPVKQF
jgi:hypothetical protein